MTDERKPTRRLGSPWMIGNVNEQDEPPYFEASFDDDEPVPAGDAWDRFHTYAEIAAAQTLDLGVLLTSAVTLRHAFECLYHDSKFLDLARNSGFVNNAKQPQVEGWLRAECRLRLGDKPDWFEQLREIANFTKHGDLDRPTLIFGAEKPERIKRVGTITRRKEARVYRSPWEMLNLSPTIIRTTLTMNAEDRKPLAIDVDETLYQMRMFFYDVMLANDPGRVNNRPIELVDEGK